MSINLSYCSKILKEGCIKKIVLPYFVQLLKIVHWNKSWNIILAVFLKPVEKRMLNTKNDCTVNGFDLVCNATYFTIQEF